MNEVCVLNKDVSLPVHTWNNKPVVSYDDIAKVHHMRRDRVRLAFKRHKDELIQGEDYFDLTSAESKVYYKDVCKKEKAPYGGYQRMKLFTESGYLVLACTFRGQEAAKVRRTLVNNYFRVKNQDMPKLTQGNIFDVAINVIEKMRDMQEQINRSNKRVDDIESKMMNVPEGSKSLTQIANEHGWYTKTGCAHRRFAGAVARACGINIDYKEPFNEELSQCINIFSNGKKLTMVYIKPAGLERIEDWCLENDNGFKCRHVTYYKFDTPYHVAGSVRQVYYTIDGVHKYVMKEE